MAKGDFEIVGRWYRSYGDELAFEQLTHPEIEWAPRRRTYAEPDEARAVAERIRAERG